MLPPTPHPASNPQPLGHQASTQSHSRSKDEGTIVILHYTMYSLMLLHPCGNNCIHRNNVFFLNINKVLPVKGKYKEFEIIFPFPARPCIVEDSRGYSSKGRDSKYCKYCLHSYIYTYVIISFHYSSKECTSFTLPSLFYTVLTSAS